MQRVTGHKTFRIGLLVCVLALSCTVATIAFNGPSILALYSNSLTDNSGDSYLAAARGSYSSRQPHSHSQYSTKKAQAAPAVVTSVSTTTASIPVNTSTPAAPLLAIPAPTVSTPAVLSPATTTLVVSNKLGSRFGISVGSTLSWLTDQELNKELDDMVALGVGWVRYDFEWDQIQAGGKTSYNWNTTDRVVKAVLAHNMKLLPILAYSPSWARTAGCASYMCGPANTTDYANFSKAVVTRYAPLGLHTWEIWNEPNIRMFWQPQPNPVFYAQMLKEAYVAIKSVDPAATVISAGLAPAATTGGNYAPLDFVAQLYAQGAGPYFDALGFHPYTFPALPSNTQSWNAWAQMEHTQLSLRSLMISNGDAAKKIWMTEFGAPTGGPGALGTLSNFNYANSPDHVDEELQTKTLTEAIDLWSKYSWAGPLFWYSYKDLGVAPTTKENFFGLIRYDGSLKPSYAALQQALSAPIQ